MTVHKIIRVGGNGGAERELDKLAKQGWTVKSFFLEGTFLGVPMFYFLLVGET